MLPIWNPSIVNRVKSEIRAEFGPNPTAISLWTEEPYGWIDAPKTDQDIIYNKLLYDWEGSAYKMQVRVPENEWLIHFTTKDFTRFTRARHIEDNIKDNQFAGGYTSYIIDLDCQKPLDQIPFGFQFAWSTSHMVYDKYYPNTIWRKNLRLFRSNSGVQHLGDNGEVVFRACSETDVASLSYTGTIDREGRGDGGFWTSDETGERFQTPLELVQWADQHAEIQRVWPLPVPGYFKSIVEIKIWIARMLLCSWSAYLQRSLRTDRSKLDIMSEVEAIAYFNDIYKTSF